MSRVQAVYRLNKGHRYSPIFPNFSLVIFCPNVEHGVTKYSGICRAYRVIICECKVQFGQSLQQMKDLNKFFHNKQFQFLANLSSCYRSCNWLGRMNFFALWLFIFLLALRSLGQLLPQNNVKYMFRQTLQLKFYETDVTRPHLASCQRDQEHKTAPFLCWMVHTAYFVMVKLRFIPRIRTFSKQ